MYEANPYPRFKFANYTASELAKPIFKAIELETSKKGLSFKEELNLTPPHQKFSLLDAEQAIRPSALAVIKMLKSQQLI